MDSYREGVVTAVRNNDRAFEPRYSIKSRNPEILDAAQLQIQALIGLNALALAQNFANQVYQADPNTLHAILKVLHDKLPSTNDSEKDQVAQKLEETRPDLEKRNSKDLVDELDDVVTGYSSGSDRSRSSSEELSSDSDTSPVASERKQPYQTFNPVNVQPTNIQQEETKSALSSQGYPQVQLPCLATQQWGVQPYMIATPQPKTQTIQSYLAEAANGLCNAMKRGDEEARNYWLSLLANPYIDYNFVTDPRAILQILIEALTDTHAQGQSPYLKQEIANITTRLALCTCYKDQNTSYRQIDSKLQDDLIKSVNRQKGMVKEKEAPVTTYLAELEYLTLAINSLKGTDSKYMPFISSLLDIFTAVFRKEVGNLVKAGKQLINAIRRESSRDKFEQMLQIETLKQHLLFGHISLQEFKGIVEEYKENWQVGRIAINAYRQIVENPAVPIAARQAFFQEIEVYSGYSPRIRHQDSARRIRYAAVEAMVFIQYNRTLNAPAITDAVNRALAGLRETEQNEQIQKLIQKPLECTTLPIKMALQQNPQKPMSDEERAIQGLSVQGSQNTQMLLDNNSAVAFIETQFRLANEAFKTARQYGKDKKYLSAKDHFKNAISLYEQMQPYRNLQLYQSLQIDKYFADTLLHIAKFHLWLWNIKHEQDEEAPGRACLERAIEVYPTYPLAYRKRAFYFADKNMYEEAYRDQERAIELAQAQEDNVALATEYEYMGLLCRSQSIVYEDAGNINEAIRLLESSKEQYLLAQQLNPNSKEAKSGLFEYSICIKDLIK